MYPLSKSISTWSKLGLFILLPLVACGCSDIIIPVSTAVGHVVNITTDPPNSRVVLESMGSRQVWSAVSPAKITYTPRPGMPTVVTVSKEGYAPKKVRLDPGMDHLHVVLEKASPLKFEFGGRTSGGMGGMGRPGLEEIPGMGTPLEATPEEELDQ